MMRPAQKRGGMRMEWRRRCGEGERVEGERLSHAFAHYVLQNDLQNLPTRPSHLMSPTAVVASQMSALQRNDWPESDSGAQTVFFFSKPEDLAAIDQGKMPRRRTWFATEAYLTQQEFTEMLHRPPYAALTQFDDWQV